MNNAQFLQIQNAINKQTVALTFLIERLGVIDAKVSSIAACQPELHEGIQTDVHTLRERMMKVMAAAYEEYLTAVPDGLSPPSSDPPNLFSSN
jgi:hypothetical protein